MPVEVLADLLLQAIEKDLSISFYDDGDMGVVEIFSYYHNLEVIEYFSVTRKDKNEYLIKALKKALSEVK